MKKYGRLLAALLSAALLLSLAACAGKTEPGGSGQTPAPGSTGGGELVWQASFTDTDWQGEFPDVLLLSQEGVYLGQSEVVGSKPFEGELSWKGAQSIYEYHLYFLNYDGSWHKLENYVPLVLTEEQESYSNYNASCRAMSLTENGDGTLTVLEDASVSYYDLPEGQNVSQEEYYNYMHWEEGYFLRTLDANGGELSRVKLPLESVYGGGLPDEAGNVLVTSYEGVYAFAPDGTMAYQITPEGDESIDDLFRLGDGRVCAKLWSEEGASYQILDAASHSLGETYAAPEQYGYYTPVPGDETYDFYYTSGTNFYGYDLENGKNDLIVNWLNSNVGYTGIAAKVLPDGTIRGIISNWGSGSLGVPPQLFTLTKVPAESLPVKQTLTLAGQYLNDQLLAEVLDFNRGSDAYNIQVTDYSQYGDDDGGANRMLTEMITGHVPDILLLDGLPYRQLAAKGLLADLYPLLEADGELKKEDFFENVLSALEVDGGLYQIAPSFSVFSLLAPADVVGEEPGWTFDEMNEALKKMPEGCVPVSAMDKESMLFEWLASDLSSYVDWAAGACSFDSPEFIQLLELVNTYGRDADFDYSLVGPEDYPANMLASGRQLTQSADLYGLYSLYVVNYEYWFGPDANVTYIGYPTRSGVGSCIQLNGGFAIGANSANKEAAWSFIRQSLTDDAQRENSGLPVKKAIFEEQLAKLCQVSYQTNVDGSDFLDENGEKVPVTASVSFPDGTEYTYDHLTDKQAERLRQLAGTASRLYESSDPIFEKVIRPVVKDFFAGKLSAEDAAKQIQSKATLYVNEQK